MLRNNPIGSILVSLFFLLALLACWYSVRYHLSVNDAQDMQIRIRTIEATMNGMHQLVNETIEYSRKNPDVDPILLKFNLKAPPAAAPAGLPPARPPR